MWWEGVYSIGVPEIPLDHVLIEAGWSDIDINAFRMLQLSPLRILRESFPTDEFPNGLISALAAHTRRIFAIGSGYGRARQSSTNGPLINIIMQWVRACSPPISCAWSLARRVKLRLHLEQALKADITLLLAIGIPIPRELIKHGKLNGHVSLTTVHRPLCNAEGSPSLVRVGSVRQCSIQISAGRIRVFSPLRRMYYTRRRC